jgi:hypothetical protein
MKKIFLIMLNFLLVSNLYAEDLIEEENTLVVPYRKAKPVVRNNFDRKYGFEINLLLNPSIAAVIDLSRNSELLMAFEHSLYMEIDDIFNFKKPSSIFSYSLGWRYNFPRNYSGSSWFIAPSVNQGFVIKYSEDGYRISVGGSILFGYMWRWDIFRFSLAVGPGYKHVFGGQNINFLSFVYPTLLLGWSF